MKYQFEDSGNLKPVTEEELATADKESAIIVCNLGTGENGKPYWVYIAVKPSKYKALQKATAERKHIIFQDYGTVLKYGNGTEVPASVKEEMKQQYGCDEHYRQKMIKEVKQQQAALLKEQEDNRINAIVAILKSKKNS